MTTGRLGPGGCASVLVLAILAVRLGVAASLHLTEDEAYYRLWAQAPAFGYFDHPPMIAWWIAAGRAVAGDGPLGVRLLPCLASASVSLLVFDLARVLGSTKGAAGRAVVWFNATLLAAAGGFLAVPDAPAALFWMACLCALARAVKADSDRPGWWLLAGVSAGLACLSKYSSLFLGPGVLLWLISSPDGRRHLLRPGPWLALIAAALVFAPNVLWNATHGWLTVSKQFGRIAPHRFTPLFVVELIVSQFVLFNPLIAVFLIRGGAIKRAWTGSTRLILAASAPFMAYLVLHALHDRVQAHWPAPLYPGLALLAAREADLAVSSVWRGLRRAAPIFGFAVAALGLGLVAAGAAGSLPLDPARPIRDWTGFASRIDNLARRQGVRWVGTTSYGLASQLLDESRLTAPVVQIAERDRWRRLDVPRPDVMTSAGLVIDLPRRVHLDRLNACFVNVAPLGDVVRGTGSSRTIYTAVRVSEARRDVLAGGCW